MSLVDYASSSGEEDDNDCVADVSAEAIAVAPSAPLVQQPHVLGPSPAPPPAVRACPIATMVSRPSSDAEVSTMPAIELPDASLLFASSPSFQVGTTASDDHASRVAAAMSANASRKREANGKVEQYPQNKHPKGNFPPRYVPGKTSSLIPPQLLGRSNVVTEDISKLFVNRKAPS